MKIYSHTVITFIWENSMIWHSTIVVFQQMLQFTGHNVSQYQSVTGIHPVQSVWSSVLCQMSWISGTNHPYISLWHYSAKIRLFKLTNSTEGWPEVMVCKMRRHIMQSTNYMWTMRKSSVQLRISKCRWINFNVITKSSGICILFSSHAQQL